MIKKPRYLPLTAVAGAHFAALALIFAAPGAVIEPVTLPVVQGTLVSQPAAAAAAPTLPARTPPASAPPPKPAAAKAPPPPPPVPVAPPSERAVTAPVTERRAAQQVEPQAQPAPALRTAPAESAPQPQAAAAPAKPSDGGARGAAKAVDAPITMPRVEAGHLTNPPPLYPPASRRFREQGQVQLDVLILADGTVGEIRIRTGSGYARLDDAALSAVRRWRYQPARRGGTPIPYWYVQPIVFSLQN